METRLLLAFVLMGLVLFLTPYFTKPQPGPKTVAPAPPSAAAAKKPAEAVTPAPVSAPAPAGAVQAGAEQEFVVDTQLFRVRLSNRGATVRSWLLKKFVGHDGKPLELINEAGLAKVPAPLTLVFKNQQPSTDVNTALFVAKPAPDGLGIDYEFSDGKTLARKSLRFLRDSYLADVTTEVTLNGTGLAHLIAWRGGFGDATVANRASAQHSLYYDVPAGKLRTKPAKEAKDGPVTAKGNYSFAGLEDTFFAAVFIPKENTATELVTVSDTVPIGVKAAEEPHVGAEVGGDAVNRFSLYVGPKDVDILTKVGPKLTQLIDWGFFGFLAKPLFFGLKALNNTFVHNWGWSIILITVLINLALLPLRLSSLRSARKMQALQPQIQAINAKYKNLGMRDPKKADQNQELMDLYKKSGVNPAGGCVPMLIQLPILFAFYTVLAVTIELRGAHWLWVSDLSQPEMLPIRILPTVMLITQIITQRMTPNPGMDPAQQKMMLLMPLAFGYFFYFQSSGLVLYWLTSNLVGIIQQWLMNRANPPVAAPPVKVIQANKKSSRN